MFTVTPNNRMQRAGITIKCTRPTVLPIRHQRLCAARAASGR